MFRSALTSMFDDSFFSGVPDHVRHTAHEFDDFFRTPALPGERQQRAPEANRNETVRRDRTEWSVARGFGDVFGAMNRMMNDTYQKFEQLEREAESSGENAHVYRSSSVYSYAADAHGGEPHRYEAHSSTRTGPGGLRETRRAVRDSNTGVEKTAIGHYIGERGHVVERHHNARTGEQQKHEQHHALGDEDAVRRFDEEWVSRTREMNSKAAALVEWNGRSREKFGEEFDHPDADAAAKRSVCGGDGAGSAKESAAALPDASAHRK